MARVGAKIDRLGALHSKVAEIFLRVLEMYDANLTRLDNMAGDDALEEAFVEEVMKAGLLPTPAMMAAVTQFLKHNNIEAEMEEVSKMTDLQRSLAERQKNRPNIVSLSSVKAANES